MIFSDNFNGALIPTIKRSLILTIVLLLHFQLGQCKLPHASSSSDQSASFDYVRPDSSPFQSFKLKNSADVLVPGKRGERKGSLHDVEIVAPPLLKKTKKAKDTLMKAAPASHGSFLESNQMLGAAKPLQSGSARQAQSGSGLPDSKAKKPETEAQRAERINKQFEKLLQFTALLGHVDSFLYDRTRSVVKTLHRMMGDNEVENFENNELRRRRHSGDFGRENTNERRTFPNELWATSAGQHEYYEPRYSGNDVDVSAE